MNNRSICLGGANTPDLLLNDGEEVLMDVSQGFRDLGLAGLIFRHKGRLIATNERVIYFKKKTKDYEIQQMNMRHAGYVSIGYNMEAKQLLLGVLFLFLAVASFSDLILLALILLILGLILVLTARVQGLVLSGSGEKIIFASKSVPEGQLSRMITVIALNS